MKTVLLSGLIVLFSLFILAFAALPAPAEEASVAPAPPAPAAASTQYHVGPGQPIERVVDVPWEALKPGDAVFIHWRSEADGGDYHAKICLTVSGSAEKPIRTAGVKGSATSVKSMHPNAWGLYDMLCGGWSVTSNYKVDNAREKEVDPTGPPLGDPFIQSNEVGPLHKSRGGYHYSFIRPNMHGATSLDGGLWEGGATIFRIVVESAPAEPATD